MPIACWFLVVVRNGRPLSDERCTGHAGPNPHKTARYNANVFVGAAAVGDADTAISQSADLAGRYARVGSRGERNIRLVGRTPTKAEIAKAIDSAAKRQVCRCIVSGSANQHAPRRADQKHRVGCQVAVVIAINDAAARSRADADVGDNAGQSAAVANKVSGADSAGDFERGRGRCSAHADVPGIVDTHPFGGVGCQR
jgi:hypothetical protein